MRKINETLQLFNNGILEMLLNHSEKKNTFTYIYILHDLKCINVMPLFKMAHNEFYVKQYVGSLLYTICSIKELC